MSGITNEQLIEHISKMSVLDLSKLVKNLEETFGVSAAAAAAAPAAVADGGSVVAEAEQTEFDVILKTIGDKKIGVIKEVRAITGLGLKEAKDLVESAGDACKVKEGIGKANAEEIAKKLSEAGATVEVK